MKLIANTLMGIGMVTILSALLFVLFEILYFIYTVVRYAN